MNDALNIVMRALLAYFALVNTVMLAFVAIAAIDVWRRRRRASFAGNLELLPSAMTTGISLVLPVGAGTADVVATVRAMLALRHPVHEVVVVADDADHETFEALEEALHLVEIPRVLPDDLATDCAVRGVWVASNAHLPLVVVRAAHGTHVDRINCGVNAARLPLVTVVEPDVVLEADALAVMAGPFVDDPRATVATLSVPRIANGCEVVGGRIAHVALPGGWLDRIVVVERLRSNLLGRVLAAVGPVLVRDANAFGLYRRDVLVEVGGFRTGRRDAALDLTARMTAHAGRHGHDHRVSVVPDPVSWATVTAERQLTAPSVWVVPSLRPLGVVEPLVELLTVVLLAVALVTGSVSPAFAGEFLVVAYVYAVFVAVCAVAVDEYAYHHFRELSDLAAAGAACVLANVGGRQLFAWWRLRGRVAEVSGNR